MSFDKDLFISYAHLDNEPLSPGQQGWITGFHKSLEALLSMRMGHKAVIWRDDRVRGNDIFANEIVQQFNGTALLISVLTPRYLNSEWCTKEVREFCKVAETTGGVVFENESRVLKVLKTPVDSQESLPPAVKGTRGYEFFKYEGNAPLELDPAYGPQFAQDYNRTLAILAWDAKQLIEKLKRRIAGEETKGDEPGGIEGNIFLAECSYDKRGAREMLQAELKPHGYKVLPDQQLPREEVAYVAEVDRLLASCSLSIHLIGATYGAVPDGPGEASTVMLQNRLAAARSKSGTLERVIWVPEGTRSTHPAQQAFIEELHSNAEAQFGADLVTGDFEQLKSSIHATLAKLKKARPETQSQAAVSASRMVYIICDQKDRKATLSLRKFLKERNIEAEIPAFEGDAKAVREANQKLLGACDAVVLFYGAGDEAWKRTVDNELKKMKAYRYANPLLACYTYLAQPSTPDKEELIELNQPNVINAFANALEGQMMRLVTDLAKTGANP